MERAGRTPEGKPYSAKVILGYLTSWKTLLFTLIFSEIPLSSLLGVMLILLSDATFRKPTVHVFCVLAQSTQQKGPASGLQCCPDCGFSLSIPRRVVLSTNPMCCCCRTNIPPSETLLLRRTRWSLSGSLTDPCAAAAGR